MWGRCTFISRLCGSALLSFDRWIRTDLRSLLRVRLYSLLRVAGLLGAAGLLGVAGLRGNGSARRLQRLGRDGGRCL